MENNLSIDDDQVQEEKNVDLDQMSGDVARVDSSGDNIDLGNETAIKGFNLADVKCDDCSRTEPIRQWRWCSACERVLCETCCVDVHNAHVIESYATGVRRSDNEHRQVMEEVRLMADKLVEGAKKADELKTEIVNKLSAIKRGMSDKINESKDVEDTMNNHLATMAKLEREPLSAKTWVERNQSMDGVEELMKVASEKQKKIDEYVKALAALVDESGRKLGNIFRKDQ